VVAQWLTTIAGRTRTTDGVVDMTSSILCRPTPTESSSQRKWDTRMPRSNSRSLPCIPAGYKFVYREMSPMQAVSYDIGLTVARVREEYWVPRMWKLAKKVIKLCWGCKRFKLKHSLFLHPAFLLKERRKDPLKSLAWTLQAPFIIESLSC
jgi:hypothetical protein